MAKTKEKVKAQPELFQPPVIKEKSTADQIQELKTGLGDLSIRMAAVVIKSDEDYQAAINLGKEGNEAIKRLKAAQAKILDKPEGWVKKVKGIFKAIIVSVETPQDALRDKCVEWSRKQEAKRLAEITKLAEKKAKEEAKVETAETVGQQQAAVTKVDKIQDKIEDLKDTKDKPVNRKRTVTVLDEKLVPREYLSVDMAKLNAIKGAVGTAFPEVAGVKFEDELAVSFR